MAARVTPESVTAAALRLNDHVKPRARRECASGLAKRFRGDPGTLGRVCATVVLSLAKPNDYSAPWPRTATSTGLRLSNEPARARRRLVFAALAGIAQHRRERTLQRERRNPGLGNLYILRRFHA